MRNILAVLAAIVLATSLLAAACTLQGGQPGPASAPPVTSGIPALPVKESWQQRWDDTLANAKKEGELLVYAIPGGETRAALTGAFKERFGINLSFVAGRGGELTEKLFRERAVGLFLADAIIAGGTTLLIDIKPRGILQPLEPLLLLPEVKDPRVWRSGSIPFLDDDKTAVSMKANYSRYVTRNTELVGENEITSYRDLLNPKWKGKMIMADPLEAGAGSSFPTIVAQTWGPEEAREFLKRLAEQAPVVTRDKRLHVESVARGKYPVGIAVDQENVATFMTMGAPISMVAVNEGGKLSSGAGVLGVPTNLPHPKATLIFVNWLLSREGQEAFRKGFITPSSRLDVSTEGIHELNFARPEEKVIMESEEHYKLQEKMRSVSRDVFAPLMK